MELDFDTLIDEYSNYLICDVAYPLITNATLNEELLLYDIDNHKKAAITLDFFEITSKQLRPDSDINSLSGGQKVVLMVLLALHSTAERILFLNLNHTLDTERLESVNARINAFKQIKQEIKVINNAVENNI